MSEILNSLFVLKTASSTVSGLSNILALILLEVKGNNSYFIIFGVIGGLPAIIALIFLSRNFYNLKRALKYVSATCGIYIVILAASIDVMIGGASLSELLLFFYYLLPPIFIVLLITIVLFIISTLRKNKKSGDLEESEYLQ